MLKTITYLIAGLIYDFSPRPTPHNRPKKVLCVGRLTRNKAQHLLLEACAVLKKNLIPFSLIFVGDGEERKSLKTLTIKLDLEREVFFAGSGGQEKVKSYYHEADMVVLPSFAEGLPVVLMEAMAIPVVATRITGIPELIEDERNGLLVTPGDKNGLAHAMERLIVDKVLAKRLGKEGRLSIEAAYNLFDNCHELATIFKDQLGHT